jgi:hypothetical protein
VKNTVRTLQMLVARRGCGRWASALQTRCLTSAPPAVELAGGQEEPPPKPTQRMPNQPRLPAELLGALHVPFARGGKREIAIRHEGIVKVPDEVEAAISNAVHGAWPRLRREQGLARWRMG